MLTVEKNVSKLILFKKERSVFTIQGLFSGTRGWLARNQYDALRLNRSQAATTIQKGTFCLLSHYYKFVPSLTQFYLSVHFSLTFYASLQLQVRQCNVNGAEICKDHVTQEQNYL